MIRLGIFINLICSEIKINVISVICFLLRSKITCCIGTYNKTTDYIGTKKSLHKNCIQANLVRKCNIPKHSTYLLQNNNYVDKYIRILILYLKVNQGIVSVHKKQKLCGGEKILNIIHLNCILNFIFLNI